MSIIFFGTPAFSVPSLKALVDSGEKVSLAITQPDKRKGRKRESARPPVKIFAESHAIPVLQPSKLREPEFIETLKDLSPEFIIVIAYGKILPPEILAVPEKGCINVHASLLPAYRGAAPIQWAIIMGERTTGITTMLMDQGMDTGDILLRQEVAIEASDNAHTLSEKLSRAGAGSLLKTLKGLRNGSVSPKPQGGAPSYAPPLEKEDGKIDWTRSAEELSRFVRGMFPWPGAFSYFRGKYIKILDAGFVQGEEDPGKIKDTFPDRIEVGTGSGLLVVRTVQVEGKKPVDAKAFANGYRIKEGDRFSEETASRPES
jgi:methionyl-tRNA formyltransferase